MHCCSETTATKFSCFVLTRVDQLSYNNFYITESWNSVRVFNICSERRSDYKYGFAFAVDEFS